MYEMIEISGGLINTNDGWLLRIGFSFIGFFEGVKEGFNSGYTHATQ